jgi:hypothetical protein
VNGIERLLNIFDYFYTQKNKTKITTKKEKEIVDNISICICRLLKSDVTPPSSTSLLIYLSEMKKSPKPKFGFDFPSCAESA